MQRPISAAMVWALVVLVGRGEVVPSQASAGSGACMAGSVREEETEEWSALQHLRHESVAVAALEVKDTTQWFVTPSSIIKGAAAASKAVAVGGIVYTGATVGAGAAVAAGATYAAKEVATNVAKEKIKDTAFSMKEKIQDTAFSMMAPSTDFESEVGVTGMPLTLGVINDTPDPVEYDSFEQVDGSTYGAPSLKKTLKPDEMLLWFMFTRGSKVRATLKFSSGSQEWNIATGVYRMKNFYSGCSSVRCSVSRTGNVSQVLDKLCKTDEEGVRVEGGNITVLLSTAGL